MNPEMTPSTVIDVGSLFFKVGRSTGDTPKPFPAIIGLPRSHMRGFARRVGEYAQNPSYISTYPIENGIVKDWDGFGRLLKHSVQIDDCEKTDPVVLTQSSMTSIQEAEKKATILFEEVGVPAALIVDQSFATLSSTGRLTGIVVDCGDGATTIVANDCVDSVSIRHALCQFNVGGSDITNNLVDKLRARGIYDLTYPWPRLVRGLKEEACYVAYDINKEKAQEKVIDTPIGEVLLESERFLCPEILFERDGGLHKAIYHTILKCPESVREEMFDNIVLGGGTTMLPGFAERLAKEIKTLAPEGTKVRVIAVQNRKTMSWEGAVTIGSLDAVKKLRATKADYDENGPSVIHKATFYHYR